MSVANTGKVLINKGVFISFRSYDAPDQVYRTASGGGARIVDKYSEKEKLTQK